MVPKGISVDFDASMTVAVSARLTYKLNDFFFVININIKNNPYIFSKESVVKQID